jgi:flagellar biosynthesis protein FliQ
MDPAILDLWSGALVTLATVAGPFIAVALAVGLLMSIIQAATQLQESVLSFAPKLIAVGLLLALTGHWLLDHLGRYFHSVVEAAVRVGQGGG